MTQPILFDALGHLSFAFFIHSVPFTAAVIGGSTSLGGSESACLGTARALRRLGHSVSIYVTQLDEACVGMVDSDGVTWLAAESLADDFRYRHYDVFVSLRMPAVFAQVRSSAKFNILWAQDLMMHAADFDGLAHQIDEVFYVSKYHRKQWEGVSAVARRMKSWVTKNGIDLRLIPKDERSLDAIAERFNQNEPAFIHISRPERGLDALLQIWPKLRARIPGARLYVARYDSMYDATGWGKVCESYDRKLKQVNEQVGGITYLGSLSKPELYKELSDSTAMLYPTSQPDFAETNCIACTEAQACGLPFVGSYRGALPETLHPDAGLLIHGDAMTEEVQQQFVDAVIGSLEAGEFEDMAVAGRLAAAFRDFSTVADEWVAHIRAAFEARFTANKPAILRRLLHDDNHAAALHLSKAMQHGPDFRQAQSAWELCERVIDQREQTAEHYAKYAIQNPMHEAAGNERMKRAIERMKEKLGDRSPRHILDLACGNGAMAILLARAFPSAHIWAFDYSEGVLKLGESALAKIRAAGPDSPDASSPDRILFIKVNNWTEALDHRAWTVHDAPPVAIGPDTLFDAAFCGEFFEHLERPDELAAALDRAVAGPVVLTTPCGPFAELLERGIPRQRGHIHAFTSRDLGHIFGQIDSFWSEYLAIGETPQGSAVGYWMFGWEGSGDYEYPEEDTAPFRDLDDPHYWHQILTERPYQLLAAGLIVKDSSNWLRGCLESIWAVTDRVVVMSFDSGEELERLRPIVEEFRDKVELYHSRWPDDFSVARNRVMDIAVDPAQHFGDYASPHQREQAPADWFLWIDADERLAVGHTAQVRLALTHQSPFLAYAVRQQHLQADAPNFHDTPCRVFRAGHGIQFFGVIHEQPEVKPDEGIHPGMQLGADFIHYGYPDAMTRTAKAVHRNLPLLRRELAGEGQHPPRRLARMFMMRDLLTLARSDIRHPGATQQLLKVVEIYQRYGFDDPSDPLHKLTWGIYQEALASLVRLYPSQYSVFEFKWAFAGAEQKLVGAPRLESFYAETLEEAERETQARIAEYLRPFKTSSIDVEPWDEAKAAKDDGTKATEVALGSTRAWFDKLIVSRTDSADRADCIQRQVRAFETSQRVDTREAEFADPTEEARWLWRFAAWASTPYPHPLIIGVQMGVDPASGDDRTVVIDDPLASDAPDPPDQSS